ncbi:MAG: FIST N-terminal domain-containing protein [Ktedonobacteraceae bacterium]
MTEIALAHTDLLNSHEAGSCLGLTLAASLSSPPDVVLVFAAPTYEHAALLHALKETCHPRILLGCSSAGEFTSAISGEGLACALALRSSEMQFTAGVGRGLRDQGGQAAEALVSTFQGQNTHVYRYRTALVFADALAGQMDVLVERLTLLTAGTYQFAGGGAGDNAQFCSTPVFFGTEVLSDAVVALEILSNIPLGIGVRHGWLPVGPALRVTQADGAKLISVNAMPAVEVWQMHAEATGQHFDPANALPFFLHTIIGITTSSGYRLRVPLSVEPDGSVLCAAEIPVGATIHLMQTHTLSATEAAADALTTALAGLNGASPGVALFFDCVATRLRMGDAFGLELQTLHELLGSTCYVGCNTHGQIARAEGQFNGFHNCTAVVCIIPA